MDSEKGDKTEAKNVPPYVPYKTFINFVDGLKVAMPSRIDKSIMGSFSGGAQTLLIAALKYLKLVGPNDHPTERLTRLVNSEGPEREKALREVLTSSYSFLFKDGLDLQRATPKQIDEHFETVGISGDTVRKCVAFFLAAAKPAGIPLSPHLSNIKRGPRTNSVRRTRVTAPLESSSRPNETSTIPPTSEQVSWSKLLLAKFPSFDPAWSPEVQAKWFDMFEKMMATGQSETDSVPEEGE